MFIDNYAPRTPEQGHTAKCLGEAMISAIQNARDAFYDDAARAHAEIVARADWTEEDQKSIAERTVYPFREWIQDNGPLGDAEGYLADSIQTCTCPRVRIDMTEED